MKEEVFNMPSVMQSVGTPNARHNLDLKYRSHLDNVDQSLSKYNEVIEHKTVEEIYAERLQEAFDNYNAKQKRKDRRLDVKYGCSTYLEYQRTLDKMAQESDNAILKQGRPPIRELIVQIGNPEEGYGCANQTDDRRQEIKEQLLEVYEEFKKNYPQLAWGDVVLHCDEVSYDADGEEHGSIHLHVSFVPLCFKNKQGPEVQVAFERCLNEMGFSSFEAWKHDMDRIMEEVLERHDLERTFADNHEKHGKSTEWHKQQKLIKENRDLEHQINMNKSIAYTAQELADYRLQEADQALDKMMEAQAKLENVEKRLEIDSSKSSSLQRQKILLEDEITVLNMKKSSLENDIEELKEEKADLMLDVECIIEVNNKHLDEMEGWMQSDPRVLVREERERRAKEQRLGLLERFFDFCQEHFPKILDLFFQQERDRESFRSKKKTLNQDRSDR